MKNIIINLLFAFCTGCICILLSIYLGFYGALLTLIMPICLVNFIYYVFELLFNVTDKLNLKIERNRFKFFMNVLKKSIRIIVGLSFIILIVYAICFVLRNAYTLIIRQEYDVFIKLIIIMVFLIFFMIFNKYNLIRKYDTLYKKLQFLCWVSLIIYLPFTYDDNLNKYNIENYVDKFYVNTSKETEAYNDLTIAKGSSFFGINEEVRFTSYKNSIKQNFQFYYVYYNINIKVMKEKIKASILKKENINPVLQENYSTKDYKIYNIDCKRFKDYKVGVKYKLKNYEQYDQGIMVENDNKIIVFYYRNSDDMDMDLNKIIKGLTEKL